ncbi:MAG: transglutaminase domain-containing protein [Chloroflexota bacterium]
MLQLPDDATLATAAQVRLDETLPTLNELPTLEVVRDQAHALLDSMPARDWDVAALADSLDYDPDRAFEFVRDSIGVDPYPGVLRGAEGTLAARSGSPADRALLLAALLDAMEVPYRFAFADLDDATAADVVDRAAVAPATRLPAPGLGATPAFDSIDIETRAARDYAQLRLALGDQLAGEGTAADEAARADVIDAVRPHVWLQRQAGAGWIDLDPTMPSAAAGAPLASATRTAATLPESVEHLVRIRLEEERLDGDTLTTHELLSYEAPAAQAAASELFLLFAPLSDELGGTIREVLTGDIEWYPTLLVDGDPRQGEPFKVSSSGTDLFGSSQEPGPELVGMRLVVETVAPDGTTREVDRMLLDRVPPEQRASGRIQASALLPMPADDDIPRFAANIRHLMVSTGGADLRAYAEERYVATDFAGSQLMDATLDDPPSAYGALWPLAASDLALVVASEGAVVPALADGSGARGFVGGPRVFITSLGRDPYRAGSLALATDLALDGVRILPGSEAGSVARLQLWYGALQTALESRMALQRSALVEPDGLALEGASLGARGDLDVVDPADPPAGAPPAMLADLASGSVVLRWDGAGASPAWWVVDPTDGATRSMIDPGLGGARPIGRPVTGERTSDSSYAYGKGPQQVPRTPMNPQAPGAYGQRAKCSGANEYTKVVCKVSLPGAIALASYVGPVVVIAAEIAVFALIGYAVATQ